MRKWQKHVLTCIYEHLLVSIFIEKSKCLYTNKWHVYDNYTKSWHSVALDTPIHNHWSRILVWPYHIRFPVLLNSVAFVNIRSLKYKRKKTYLIWKHCHKNDIKSKTSHRKIITAIKWGVPNENCRVQLMSCDTGELAPFIRAVCSLAACLPRHFSGDLFL